jgi:hypothetical protein
MMALIKLIFAHLLGDFILQPKKWVMHKENLKAASPFLYVHMLLHGILTVVLLGNGAWLPALLLMLLHGIVDAGKLYLQTPHRKTTYFLLDQLLHLACITIVWYIFFNQDVQITNWLQSPTLWLYAAAILFITLVSAIIMRELMHTWSQAINDGTEESLNNAGKYIGMLERLFVFVFVVTGRWEGVGFLLAAKSIFRFGDLKESKDRKLTEYILIGTLLSFGIAMGTGMLVAFLQTSL